MTENTSPSKCMPSSYRDGNRPLYRCDTPSLVASTPEPSNCYGVSSIDLNHFKRDLDFAEQSADLEKKTNSGRSNRLGEEKKSRQFQRWTSFEDQSLEKGVQMGDGPPHDWKKIALDHLAGMRSPRQCKSRWKNALRPDINHGPFSAEEDNALLYYRKIGLGWPAIASHLPGRVAEQVRDRFVNYIDPSRQTSPWTLEEDKLLIELQAMHGNKWTYISMLIPGRSENSIKNRWHNRKTQQRRTMRREFARLNAASSQVATTQIATTNTRGSQQLRTVKVEDIKEDVAGRNPCNGEVEDTGTEQGANGACTVKVEDVDRDIDEV